MRDILRVMWDDLRSSKTTEVLLFILFACYVLSGLASTLLFVAAGWGGLNAIGQVTLIVCWTVTPIGGIVYWVRSAIKRT